MTSDISTLANWIRTSPSTVFFGGAGVSTESGIPDFRGANGFYFQERTIPLEQVLSIDFFSVHLLRSSRLGFLNASSLKISMAFISGRAHAQFGSFTEIGSICCAPLVGPAIRFPQFPRHLKR